jgi:hypothetical protein
MRYRRADVTRGTYFFPVNLAKQKLDMRGSGGFESTARKPCQRTNVLVVHRIL